jgi:penicillin-binding protein 2
VLALLLILLSGLGYWQLHRSAELTNRERRQSTRRIILPAPRGVIYDREHRVLAGNRTRLAATLALGDLRREFAAAQRAASGNKTPNASDPANDLSASAVQARREVVQRYLARINTLTGRHESVASAEIERAFTQTRLERLVLGDDLTDAEAGALIAGLAPGGPLRVEARTERWYPHGALAAHALGRVRSAAQSPPEAAAGRRFRPGPFTVVTGDSGLEKQYEARLQGKPGDALAHVDVWGFPVGDPTDALPATSGLDVVSSLDLDLQQTAEKALAATAEHPHGAAVVLDVATGEVLALASQPDFDLNAVMGAIPAATKRQLDANGSWLNRATQGLYPPGSTFKIFTMLAGLRAGTLHPHEALTCPGSLMVGGRRFPCHNPEGHGALVLRDALARSCNVFAYQVGLAAGPDALAAEARRFHLDDPTGLDWPAETARMLVPDPHWKESEGRGVWTPGDTANLAVGQGFLRVTPLQLACAIASLARGETLTVPTLLHQPGRRPTGDRAPEPLAVDPVNRAALLEALQAVVESGIGQNAQVAGISIAGKTGTAQIARAGGTSNIAWFVAFAPVEQPEIALAVALEGDRPGVEYAGADKAAPVIHDLIAAYFAKHPR